MTVIAWDGTIIAADRQCNSGETKHPTKKLFIIGDSVVGYTGDVPRGEEMLLWYKNGAKIEKFPEAKGELFAALIVCNKKGFYFYENHPYIQKVKRKFYARGSGSDYALGAMAVGANAIDAVKATNLLCVSCGFGVQYFNINDL